MTAVFPFMPVDKSAFTAAKVEAVRMEYQFADNLNHREVERYVSAIEEWILSRKDSLHVRSTYTYFTNNLAFTRAYLATGWTNDEGATQVRKLLRGRLPELPGLTLKLDDGNNDGGGPSRVAVRGFGEPGARMDDLAAEVARRMALVNGVHDVVRGGDKGSEEVEVIVDRARAAQYGLNTASVANAVTMFFRGRPLSRFRGPEG